MTTSTTRRTFSVDQIVRAAFRLAGLVNEGQSPSSAQYENGREVLDFTLMGLQADNQFARTVREYTIATADGVSEYTLPDYVVQVMSDGVYTLDDMEYRLTQIGPETWRELTSKAFVSGMPTMFYVYRGGEQQIVRLYPTPNEVASITLNCQMFRYDSTEGSKLPDMELFWVDYLRYKLAHELALAASLPEQRISYLGQIAGAKLMKCSAAANKQTDIMFVNGHATDWR